MNKTTKQTVMIHSAASILGVTAGLLVAGGKSHNTSQTISYIILGLVIGNVMAAPITYLVLKDNNKLPEPAKQS